MGHLQRDIQRCSRVAVYGTLKQGQHNHYWLNGAPLLGNDCLTAITLYDLGHYPGAKAEASAGSVVEVYTINTEQLALLDQLEGYYAHAPKEGLYNRVILTTRHGEAWCYLYNSEAKHEALIENGEW